MGDSGNETDDSQEPMAMSDDKIEKKKARILAKRLARSEKFKARKPLTSGKVNKTKAKVSSRIIRRAEKRSKQEPTIKSIKKGANEIKREAKNARKEKVILKKSLPDVYMRNQWDKLNVTKAAKWEPKQPVQVSEAVLQRIGKPDFGKRK